MVKKIKKKNKLIVKLVVGEKKYEKKKKKTRGNGLRRGLHDNTTYQTMQYSLN